MKAPPPCAIGWEDVLPQLEWEDVEPSEGSSEAEGESDGGEAKEGDAMASERGRGLKLILAPEFTVLLAFLIGTDGCNGGELRLLTCCRELAGQRQHANLHLSNLARSGAASRVNAWERQRTAESGGRQGHERGSSACQAAAQLLRVCTRPDRLRMVLWRRRARVLLPD
jgi:hypothetical protein